MALAKIVQLHVCFSHRVPCKDIIRIYVERLIQNRNGFCRLIQTNQDFSFQFQIPVTFRMEKQRFVRPYPGHVVNVIV